MLCALCSIAPKMGITKGRRQNIVRGPAQTLLTGPSANRVQQPKAVIFGPGLPFLQLDSPKRLRTMFCGIHLYGAEINAEFSEQHRAHLTLLL